MAVHQTFQCLVRQSTLSFEEWLRVKDLWRYSENDSVILTRYFKGSGCDLPIPEKMTAQISNDTLYFDFGRVYDPNCERTIGVAGIFIDFIVNKEEYPDYEKLVITYKYDNPNW